LAKSATDIAGDMRPFTGDEFHDTRGQLTGTVPEFNVSSAILHQIIKDVVLLNNLKLTR
jgi:hypothetical protein